MNENMLIEFVFSLLNQVKLFHWSTTSYAKHKALDDLHSSLSDKTDTLIECFIGKYQRQPLGNFKITTSVTSDCSDIILYLQGQLEILDKIHKELKRSTELQNIVDEIKSEIDKTIYLCNLS